ncbi:hypothetical protein C8E83_1202 [Frondihabitans australicus]|uniref:Uncharacterized protein n=2 Tax=Frondihabitans australicus TaxID=386892 RepID=A0A495IGA0_9MICO|nr:hypothetical protein C8E83_1202 [Frondihabitans australicus]
MWHGYREEMLDDGPPPPLSRARSFWARVLAWAGIVSISFGFGFDLAVGRQWYGVSWLGSVACFVSSAMLRRRSMFGASATPTTPRPPRRWDPLGLLMIVPLAAWAAVALIGTSAWHWHGVGAALVLGFVGVAAFGLLDLIARATRRYRRRNPLTPEQSPAPPAP